jgi:serine/threonine protein kinase/tetratricopeptide (TPR) repeat protein
VGPESVIGERFRIVERVGAGGMGTVYRAVDLEAPRQVALKLLDPDYDRLRFEREVEVLAELEHPRIVRYVAHGVVGSNQAFLAMEWLEGEDLAMRLHRSGLTLRESLRLIRDLASGLAVAHAREIVHRDLKPSNVFLRDSSTDGATVLDFGVARRMGDSQGPRTRTGTLVGTPNYMAPEQASGERAVGPPADVFALGCILYECLIGSPPFVAEHLVGVLAKILFADAEAIGSLRPDIPESVADLVAKMLAKSADQRPADASALLVALDRIGDVPDAVPPGALTAHTLRERPRMSRPMITSSEQQLVCVIVASVPSPLPEAIRERHRIERLSDGTYVATILPSDQRVAMDQAVHAARVALDIREAAPTARIALTTGRGVVKERLPIGEAIDRAIKLMPLSTAVVVDELSSALIDRRFEITGGSRLVAEIADHDALHVLLGKPTPCVGREQELATLEATLTTCIDEGTASAVLVTAPAGMGKTRLRHELVRRARARHPDVEVLVGVGDASRVGTTYSILSNAAPELHVGEELAAAFIALLDDKAKKHPVLLVLEDIHWADSLSLKLIERALRELHERPLMVLALSRPLPDDRLWAGHALRMPLRPLSRRACERLSTEILGADVRPDVVARIVEQAAGNALFLEELIRAVKEGRRELPDSVVAMLQSRIAGLASELRLVLRTAAVFGERFTRGGVATLLDVERGDNPSLDGWLAELTRLEIIESRVEAFAFRHALVAEAAYGLLTQADREAAHLAAAKYLETLSGQAPVELAEHYHRANALALAVPCYMRAGAEANAVGDVAAARMHYAAASDALRGLPDEPLNRRTRIDILVQQAQIGIISEMPELNIARAQQARELLASLEPVEDDRRRQAQIDYLWGRVLSYLGRLRESVGMCERVVPVARQLRDDKLAHAANQTIGNVAMMQGRITQAEPALANAAVLAGWIGSDFDRLRYLGDHGICLMMAGRYREAVDLHTQAVEHATSSKSPSGLAIAYAMRAFSERVIGDPIVHETIQVALEHAERGQERLLDYLLVAHRAWVEGLAGRRELAREQREESRSIADALGGKLFYEDLFVAADAQVALALGDLDEAIEIASQAVPTLHADELMLGLGLCEQVWGLALGARGDHAADEHLARARSIYDETGQRTSAARLALEWSHLARSRGNTAQADELRASAIDAYTSAGAAHLIDALDASVRR